MNPDHVAVFTTAIAHCQAFKVKKILWFKMEDSNYIYSIFYKYNLCIVSPLNTIYCSFHSGSGRDVIVPLARGCAEFSYQSSNPEMKTENRGVDYSPVPLCRANLQMLWHIKQGLGHSQHFLFFLQ
ncbi:hypothetical protein T09_10125 [Trichinella sp. T9]|nr:hypothetical protein T09_6495 [Trichinella sp. T9]KRX57119.1 hypothetical protein T09_10125 [Trichinella sp. T9]